MEIRVPASISPLSCCCKSVPDSNETRREVPTVFDSHASCCTMGTPVLPATMEARAFEGVNSQTRVTGSSRIQADLWAHADSSAFIPSNVSPQNMVSPSVAGPITFLRI